MIRKWPTLETALADERFLTYLKQLERRYSTEKSEHMLATLGIELGRERQLYASDLEYAAALLDTDPESIDDLLLQPRGAAPNSRWPASSARPKADNQASPRPLAGGAPVPSSKSRSMLIVWAPFVLGISVLAISALLLRTLAE
jgi:hypothetical protein